MDIPEISEVFDSEFKADPYGTAAAIIKEVLEAALGDTTNEQMSEGEYDILAQVALLLNSLDPDLEISPRPA